MENGEFMAVCKTRLASQRLAVRALGFGPCKSVLASGLLASALIVSGSLVSGSMVSGSMAWADSSPSVAAPSTDPRPALDSGLQGLKKDALDLKVELFSLREDLLFPSSNQLAVFVSMDVGEFLSLDSVQLRVDEVEVANYLYTAREASALLKGGVQRLYLGNLKTGEHELVAVFIGTGPHHREYRRAATVRVTKALVPKYVELKITDRKVRAQPEFEIRDWE